MRRPGNAGGRAGAGYGGVGRRQSPECPPAQPLMPGSSGISLEREGGDPWSLSRKTGEAGSFHSSSSALESPVHPTNLPTLSRCPQILKSRYISKGLLASLKQAGQERPLDSCSSWARGLAGGGWEQPVLEGQGRGWEDTGGAGQGPRMCTHAGWRRRVVTGSGSTVAYWVSVHRWWVAH